jgi:hypothetical protein
MPQSKGVGFGMVVVEDPKKKSILAKVELIGQII